MYGTMVLYNKLDLVGNVLVLVSFVISWTYSGGKNKRQKPDFSYKIGIFKRLFRDKNIGELHNPSKS